MQNEQLIVSVLVANHPGALIRVSSLFSRRGINISSLNVTQLDSREIARITLVAEGGAQEKGQIAKQLEKIYDVKKVELIETDSAMVKKRLLVCDNAKKERPGTGQAALLEDLKKGSLLVEITGDSKNLNAFVDYVRPYGMIEMHTGGQQ
jgi:acetolactate synthase-1/3 small subunit